MGLQQSGKVSRGLGGPNGLGEIMAPRSDDGSLRVNASGVFRNGLRLYDSVLSSPILYVNTNGTVSFGSEFGSYRTGFAPLPTQTVIAPFWGDVDTRLDGEGHESGAIWVDLDPETGVLTVTWENVGVYRRNAEVTNLFQIQMYAGSGSDFDVVFRYETLGWTQGTAEDDIGALAGFFGSRGESLALGGADLTMLSQSAGNTGTQGFWAFSVQNGAPRAMALTSGVISGTNAGEKLTGSAGNDRIFGFAGNDSLEGGNGRDILSGGEGDDFIFGGRTSADIGDFLLGGAGHDSLEGGYGNDLLLGEAGEDVLTGGPGADTLIGHAGDDTLTGSGLSDLLFGGPGEDFLNGGYGSDRLNGGPGGDQFYHHGAAEHGTDWIQDYTATEGDLLVFGGAGARAKDFLVQYAKTPGAGLAHQAEAFVTHIPSGQILWVLVDGADQDMFRLQLGSDIFDLLA